MPTLTKSSFAEEIRPGLITMSSTIRVWEISTGRPRNVVLAMGRKAQSSWKRFSKREGKRASSYPVINSLHTSRLGITNGSRHSAAEGHTKICRAMREALQEIDNGDCANDAG